MLPKIVLLTKAELEYVIADIQVFYAVDFREELEKAKEKDISELAQYFEGYVKYYFTLLCENYYAKGLGVYYKDEFTLVRSPEEFLAVVRKHYPGNFEHMVRELIKRIREGKEIYRPRSLTFFIGKY